VIEGAMGRMGGRSGLSEGAMSRVRKRGRLSKTSRVSGRSGLSEGAMSRVRKEAG
jgi:hypothetical protein